MTIKTQPKNKIYNEIYPLIIEKQKILDVNELLVYQLIKLYSEADKGVPRSYRPTPEAHATLFFKKVQSLHLEYLKISIGRAGWKVTKLYAYYAFGQESLKKVFILINQCSRQTTKNSVEKKNYKLLDNSNFGYYCLLDTITLITVHSFQYLMS